MEAKRICTKLKECAVNAEEMGPVLTNVCNLPFTDHGMDVRGRVVHEGGADRIVQALCSGDEHLRCKAANALGSLLAAPAAAAQILHTHRARVLEKLRSLTASQSLYAQADGCFALGWIVDVDDAFHEQVEILANAATIVKDLCSRTGEKVSQARTYALVLLCKFCSRFPPEHYKPLVQGGIIESASHMLAQAGPASTDDEGTCMLCVRVLERLASGGAREVCQRMVDAKCIAALAKLTKHPQEELRLTATAAVEHALNARRAK